ncbi:alpha/beta hydrolase [Microbacterium sp. NPDC019599]|uniref:alpha/beta hydrolase n=1 Tax=Microbacterium sp. NPDC019599 TaxID=3154690 RepID=UPI003408F56C
MEIAQVDPSLRAATEKAPVLKLENGFNRWMFATLSGLAPGTRIDGVERRIVRRDARVRVYTPSEASGAGLLWIHGGGLVLGSAAVDDRMCAETALATGATVVSVDYRLAPRHPFPTPLEDCANGFSWMLRHAAELGIDTDRIAVGGQSAGGGLAASLVQRLHDEGVSIAAQWLFCPMIDDRTAANRTRDAEGHFVWNNRSNLVGWRSYLGDRVGAPALPRYAAAARREDLTGLPATWLYSSDIELFFDEDRDYAQRLAEAGVDVTFETISGAPHGFEAWAPDSDMAVRLVARARDWLGQRLG